MPVAIAVRVQSPHRAPSMDSLERGPDGEPSASKSLHRFCVRRIYPDGSRRTYVYREPTAFDSHYGSPPVSSKQLDL